MLFMDNELSRSQVYIVIVLVVAPRSTCNTLLVSVLVRVKRSERCGVYTWIH